VGKIAGTAILVAAALRNFAYAFTRQRPSAWATRRCAD
jgi:hypothetical protein